MTVAIVDCGGANLRSVQRAIELRNMKTTITNKKSDILKASYVILPGVGSADSVMSSLKSNDLVEIIKSLSQPVLGICIGMHILFESSEENHTSCMGIISGKIKKFKFKDSFKVPQMGWNKVSFLDNAQKTLDEHYYFANSFYAVKVQFFNEMYALCKTIGCDYETTKNLMLKNGWINPMHTIVPGTDGEISYGGYCFPKDTNALLQFMKSQKSPREVLEATVSERNKMRSDNVNVKFK